MRRLLGGFVDSGFDFELNVTEDVGLTEDVDLDL